MNDMREQLTSELPEATYEEVTNVQHTLSFWVIKGVLTFTEENGVCIYRPRVDGNMLTVERKDSGGMKSEDLYYQLNEIRYPSNPTPSDTLRVSHFNYKWVTSELSLRGISNLYIGE